MSDDFTPELFTPSVSLRTQLTTTALTLPEDTPYEDWLAFGQQLERLSRSVMWYLGDWWAFGRHHYGDRVKAVEFLPWSYGVCMNAASVARKITTSCRHEVLPWSLHYEAARMDDPRPLLDAWATRGTPPSEREARAEVNAIKRNERRRHEISECPPLSDEGPFDLIYADPPWRYDFSPTDNRAIENQYPTMALDEICELRPPVLDNAVLFLWATSPKLREALDVVRAWGFEFRTTMAWIKDSIGMGHYVREQHELLLIARRGDMPVPEPESRPASALYAPRGKHSAKPEEFYKLIEAMYPGRLYGEIFARNRREGWGSWGNQI
jgi:N6-adenosine-specific RNA methylase IME4